jgi:phage I-like protein
MSAASAPTQRRQSPAAAPVSRDVTPSGERKRTIRLTKEEAEIARLTGQTEAEYYQNKMRDLN